MQHKLLVFLAILSTALAAEVVECSDLTDDIFVYENQRDITANVNAVYDHEGCLAKACENCTGTCTEIFSTSSTYKYCTGICDDVCSSCQNKTCTQCVSGYGLFEGSCFACSQGCTECTVYNGTQGLPVSTCTQCPAGSQLYQGGCVSCGDNCDACTVSDGNPTCTQCASGYGVSEGACDSCASNCNACTFEIAGSDPQCTQCSSNYGVYEGSCYHCLQDCTYSCNITPNSDDEYSTTCILAPPPSTTSTHSPSSGVRDSVAYLAMGVIGFYLAL